MASGTINAGFLSEPDPANPFVTAADWTQGVLLGSVATAVAVIAVAAFGVLLLTGRLSLRRGLTMVAGCFVLFGSNTIAKGILAGFGPGAGSTLPSAVPPVTVELSPLQSAVPQPTPSPTPYDPYAGAAVPQQH
ncbi:TrbC/VirB2 family protein [Sphingomonas elodea]|uniref:TrbC/VirB2 family protein n=1 Tax=Sphingomonas elodea TaxID=179878 RepID=UPI0002630A7D|nr:TrbC/VirB2 family protein [Sphingomonas elodea]